MKNHKEIYRALLAGKTLQSVGSFVIKLNLDGNLVHAKTGNLAYPQFSSSCDWFICEPKKVLFKDWKEGVIYCDSLGYKYRLKNRLPWSIENNQYSINKINWFGETEFTEVKDETNNFIEDGVI